MTLAAAAHPDPEASWQRLLARLAARRLRPAAEPARLGGVAADQVDPALRALLPEPLRPAAVLVGLVDDAAQRGLLLTVRAAHLRQHAGQIAFPGGALDAGDADVTAAALREAREEVGLEPQGVQLLGFLPDQLVITGFRITPVVARLPAGFEPRIAADEVAEAFLLPWHVLLDPSAERRGQRRIAGFDVPSRDLQYGQHRIWGATASMLFALQALALP